jgi:hypothetical protein
MKILKEYDLYLFFYNLIEKKHDKFNFIWRLELMNVVTNNCSNCGITLNTSDNYCPSCGNINKNLVITGQISNSSVWKIFFLCLLTGITLFIANILSFTIARIFFDSRDFGTYYTIMHNSTLIICLIPLYQVIKKINFDFKDLQDKYIFKVYIFFSIFPLLYGILSNSLIGVIFDTLWSMMIFFTLLYLKTISGKDVHSKLEFKNKFLLFCYFLGFIFATIKIFINFIILPNFYYYELNSLINGISLIIFVFLIFYYLNLPTSDIFKFQNFSSLKDGALTIFLGCLTATTIGIFVFINVGDFFNLIESITGISFSYAFSIFTILCFTLFVIDNNERTQKVLN